VKIGLLDSGVGGLTVLHQLIQKFPYHDYIYYGDSGRAPYGNRSKEELFQFNQSIINFLRDDGISLLVMACNTSCAWVLQDIRSKYQLPILGLIEPATKEACQQTQTKRIAILATQQTVNSNAYYAALTQCRSDLSILQIPCPKLVPIVENDQLELHESQKIALEYFDEVQKFKADTLIYGCSHYPYFESIFKSVASSVNYYIDPAKSIISDVKKHLENTPQSKKGQVRFFVSGDISKFTNFIRTYFNGWETYPIIPHAWENHLATAI